MDLLPSVDLLRDHLVAHDRAVRQIIALDQYIERMSEQTFLSTLGEHMTPAFQKMIRISVAEGLKRMYKEYRLSKWLKVQEMALTVRRVLDAETAQFMPQSPSGRPYMQQGGQILPHGPQYFMPHGAPYIPHVAPYIPQGEGQLVLYNHGLPWQPQQQPNPMWVMPAPEEFQWHQSMEGHSQHANGLRGVYPGEHHNMISNGPAVDERPIRLVSNISSISEHVEVEEIVSANGAISAVLDCAISDISGLSDSSDEFLDSVNVVNPHFHMRSGPASYSGPLATSAHPGLVLDNQVNQGHLVPYSQNVLPSANNQLHPVPEIFVHQSAGIPIMPQQYNHYIDNELPSDLDDSMDWASDDSDYNDSEEDLAGVLFAAERLLPEEQAVRLDVEMGDMGIGHMLFDRVSATWYISHCEFYRGE
ncbi:uncharacterized protein LOC127872810 [Dreissena polymorpha]|uniref:uncharacterized protein LOC127872810 n=1 Tax=Dreissena polymorpha TaxID=45954 RepID=UPI0022641EF4|nr:uncharacterized protein LOC127872810 [Dreissena polymorpha]